MAEITDIALESKTVMVSSEKTITVSLSNTGKDTLYNVTAEAKGDYITSKVAYVGDVLKDGTGSAIIKVTGNEISMEAVPVEITINYEDANGNPYSIKDTTNIKVIEYTTGSYNSNFYGKLKDAEKNKISMVAVMRIVLMVLVTLIVIVVGVHLYTKLSLTKKAIENNE